MNISLTPELEEFVLREVKRGLYQSASEVIRAGLRSLKEEHPRRPGFMVSSMEELQEKLLDGINSGKASAMTKEDWKRIRERVQKRSKKRAR
jgi:antitoxin ParD1/3/4